LPASLVARARDSASELGEALCRETFEETSIDLSNHKIKYITKYYVNHGNVNFIYHVFSVNLDTFPKVSINNLEHKDFDWYTKEDSLKLGLVEDMDEVIKECVLI
jgi:8-oxo-dGTP pyrophosphatase MutT (NUDIX family)